MHVCVIICNKYSRQLNILVCKLPGNIKYFNTHVVFINAEKYIYIDIENKIKFQHIFLHIYFVFLSCLIKLKYVEDCFSYLEKATLTEYIPICLQQIQFIPLFFPFYYNF